MPDKRFRKILDILREYSFTLPLPDRYLDPKAKDFVCPDDDVICDAVLDYANSMHYSVGFISRKAPVRFSMDGKIYHVEQKKERASIYGGSAYSVTCVSEPDAGNEEKQ